MRSDSGRTRAIRGRAEHGEHRGSAGWCRAEAQPRRHADWYERRIRASEPRHSRSPPISATGRSPGSRTRTPTVGSPRMSSTPDGSGARRDHPEGAEPGLLRPGHGAACRRKRSACTRRTSPSSGPRSASRPVAAPPVSRTSRRCSPGSSAPAGVRAVPAGLVQSAGGSEGVQLPADRDDRARPGHASSAGVTGLSIFHWILPLMWLGWLVLHHRRRSEGAAG